MLQKRDIATIAIPPDRAFDILPHVRDYLTEAGRRNYQGYNETATLLDLQGGKLTLWIATDGDEIEAVLLTRLLKEVDGTACYLVSMGGQGGYDWSELLGPVEEYAKTSGCCRMRLEGRLGWKRKLAGYVQTGVILAKPLG